LEFLSPYDLSSNSSYTIISICFFFFVRINSFRFFTHLINLSISFSIFFFKYEFELHHHISWRWKASG
jgi:hypothetical protein